MLFVDLLFMYLLLFYTKSNLVRKSSKIKIKDNDDEDYLRQKIMTKNNFRTRLLVYSFNSNRNMQ